MEALAFPKDYSTGRNHFIEERESQHNTLKTCGWGTEMF